MLIHRTNVSYRFRKNIFCDEAFLNRVKISIKGKNSKVFIGPKSQLNNCNIILEADNTELYITGFSTNISNCLFDIKDKNGKIFISKGFTIQGGSIISLNGTEITIGEDCMFSNNISISSGDFHPITNLEGTVLLNPSQDIKVGNHVWIGANVVVLKGSMIADNSVIGNSSLVSGRLLTQNSVYAGIPAKLLKRNIDWHRNRNLFDSSHINHK